VILIGTRRGAQCDDQGRFRIERVPAGSYTLRGMALGYEDVRRSIDVKPGGIAHADLVVVTPLKVKYENYIHVHGER
jgi:hypothetical protein